MDREKKNYTVTRREGYTLVENRGGPVLGVAGAGLKEAEGFAFKNLSGAEELLPYEDWRLSAEERAADLAGRLSVEEMAGLMLFSPHQMVPFLPGFPFVGHYGGGDYVEGVTDPAALTDEQLAFIQHDRIRNVLLNHTQSAQAAVRWNNRLQALAESQPWGIPVCISSDPRHAAGARSAEFSAAGKEVSRWPEGLGMAATFSPELMEEFAHVVAREYRALGITVALGPQIDPATDPRWLRLEDTWGGSIDLVTEMARAYCDGLQTTPGAPEGWGRESVAAMVKHWPGGGTGEGGRDAHYPFGKYAVYPGGRMREHMRPFTEGAFRLHGPTGKAAAVMPYYTISYGQDPVYGENVGNAYSRYIVDDLLRGEAGYDGVVCTDWEVTGEPSRLREAFTSRCHGVEHLSEAEQHLKILLNGVDMFGGNSRAEPLLRAYEMGCDQLGEEAMRRRMEQSARRILTNLFRLGLFEQPYLDEEESRAVLGCPKFVERGRFAQEKSAVLLKNKGGVLPLARGNRLYVPQRHIRAHLDFFRRQQPAQDIRPLTAAEAAPWFTLVDDPDQADAALVLVESPLSDGYTYPALTADGSGYVPISLQYRPYRADTARAESIAGGDPREERRDRSYRGRVGTARNEGDLDLILNARRLMGDRPVVVCLHLHNPAVVAEFEGQADGILAHFGLDVPVMMELLCGDRAPGGRLPVIMPASMETVEAHFEDVFDDIEPYRDQCGSRYDFGFGLSYGKENSCPGGNCAL